MNSLNLTKLFTYTCVVLPSGFIFGINFKVVVLSLVLISLIMARESRKIISVIKYIMPVMMLLLFFIAYSFFVNEKDEYILTQAKDIIVFFLFPIVILSVYTSIEQRNEILNVIINALFFVGILKIGMLIFSFISGMPISLVVQVISKIFNVSIVSLDVESSVLGRINFSSDAALPLAIFVLARKIFKGDTEHFIIIKALMLMFSVLIGMSRFYWAATALFLLYATILTIKSKRAGIFSILCVCFLLFASTLTPVQDMINARFSSDNIAVSDGIRTVQLNHMLPRLEQSPLLGKGLGYYMPEYVRGLDAKYSYELQIPALVMQIGYVGFFSLFFLIFLPVLFYALKLNFLMSVTVLSMFSIWIASGFFNPVLFSSAGGVVYTMILLISIKSRNEKYLIVQEY